MKKLVVILLFSALMSATAMHAQFSRIVQMSQAQQATSVFSYKGFADVSYTAGIGHYRAGKFEATTSHGLSSGNLFLGAGLGIDILKTETESGGRWEEDMKLSDNAYMIPLFLDFRYSGNSPIAAYIDLKTGISFLTGDDYITINDGILDNDVSFYLSCSFGARFALGSRSAFNVGVTYSLISQRYYGYDDYFYYHDYNGISLHGIGITAGFEW